jgi:hypothetical protein
MQLNLSQDFLLRHLSKLAVNTVAAVVDQNIYEHAVALKLIEQKLRSGRSR